MDAYDRRTSPVWRYTLTYLSSPYLLDTAPILGFRNPSLYRTTLCTSLYLEYL